jgi:translocation protein SEC63
MLLSKVRFSYLGALANLSNQFYCLLVIGERVVAPSSIVFLVLKLRISPPGRKIQRRELSVDETKVAVKYNDEMDDKFLNSKSEVEEFKNEETVATSAHAPYWPGVGPTLPFPLTR